MVPDLSESVSVDREGRIHVTVANLSVSEAREIETIVSGEKVKAAQGEILVGGMKDHNTFDKPEQVKPVPFEGVKLTGGESLSFQIPACSVVHLVITV